MADFTEGRVTRELARQEALEADARKWRALLAGLFDDDFDSSLTELVNAMRARESTGFQVELPDHRVVKLTVTSAMDAVRQHNRRRKAARKGAETRMLRRAAAKGAKR